MASVYTLRFLKAATLPDGTKVSKGETIQLSADDASLLVQSKIAVIVAVRTTAGG